MIKSEPFNGGSPLWVCTKFKSLQSRGLLLKREVCRRFCLENATFSNKLNFFPQVQISIFLREATLNDHNRLLHKFEIEQKNFDCVRSCGYALASVNGLVLFCWDKSVTALLLSI